MLNAAYTPESIRANLKEGLSSEWENGGAPILVVGGAGAGLVGVVAYATAIGSSAFGAPALLAAGLAVPGVIGLVAAGALITGGIKAVKLFRAWNNKRKGESALRGGGYIS